jgi:hypothetical protein
MSTITKRKKLYNKITSILEKDDSKMNKIRIIGKGGQGEVNKYCTRKNDCVAVKKSYIEYNLTKYIDNIYNKNALKHGLFIEICVLLLIKQVVLQRICPHFVLSYTYIFKKYTSICSDEYPYKVYQYKEYIESEMYSEWVKREHPIKEWFNIYFQVTVALFSLQYHFNMKHLDLHAENILIKKVSKGGYWKYVIGDDIYYVPNLGYIVYIIDFGHAWVPNQFQSWFIRQRYKNKNIKKNFDIMNLFKSTLTYSKSPESFKKQIKNYIKNLHNMTFEEWMINIWYEYTIKPNDKIIETYKVKNDLDVENIPQQLRHIVVHKK